MSPPASASSRAAANRSFDLGVERGGIVIRGVRGARIRVVLRLLAHVEEAGRGHLDLAQRVPAQELEILDLDRVLARLSFSTACG